MFSALAFVYFLIKFVVSTIVVYMVRFIVRQYITHTDALFKRHAGSKRTKPSKQNTTKP